MTPIALLRHFPTEWNRERRLQGRSDQPLLDDSIEDLAGLALPAPWNEARIIASPLIRATATAKALAAGQPVRTDARLVELSWGTWEGRLATELAADPNENYTPTGDWTIDQRAPGGESLREAWIRIAPALAEIAHDQTPALLVIHKALMRVILRRAHEPAEVGHISSRKLHPLMLSADGMPCQPSAPIRMIKR